MNLKRAYNSRFWMTLATILVLLANHVMDWNLNGEEIAGIVGVAAAFVLGESWRKSKVQP